MNNTKLFVEKRPEGYYAVTRPDSERASDVLPTQVEAIKRAKVLNQGSAPWSNGFAIRPVTNQTSGENHKYLP